MDKILDMMAQWEPIGQGLFLLIVIGSLLTAATNIVRYGVVLARGWPPCCEDEEDQEEDTE